MVDQKQQIGSNTHEITTTTVKEGGGGGQLLESSTGGVGGCRVQSRLGWTFRPTGNQLALARNRDRRRCWPRRIERRGGVVDERDTETLGDAVVSLDELDAQSDVGSMLEGPPKHARRVRDGWV